MLKPLPLEHHLIDNLDYYFSTLEGEQVCNLHAMVMQQVEKPLIEYVLTQTSGNQTQTAAILGINRNTLRKKMQHYNLMPSNE
ncbi:helix-turn-helix domain-containing protein [Thiomicrospira sp. ALE5]|uniref:helix-turn-helix domain-containing protein n=1 Tax=Thiomicrospira sp. ALE5 TaxID=748650 RepID=UPI0008E535AE|nr:helix-turn-helix domain-containing protein [Thiomicrospira sp. ALE5]SFR61114.1 Fis family transcriptional regulator, factor for inversion stimulation protein [Thiomicrospira sp. ALE5]